MTLEDNLDRLYNLFHKLLATEPFFNQNKLWDFLHALAPSTAPPKTLIITPPQVCDHLHIVTDGIVRSYYVKENQQYTFSIRESLNVFYDSTSYIYGIPGELYFESVTEIKYFTISKIHISKYIESDPQIGFIFDQLSLSILRDMELRLFSLQTEDLSSRYLSLKEKHPHWLEAVPQQHLASYLSAKPESLSRVKKMTEAK